MRSLGENSTSVTQQNDRFRQSSKLSRLISVITRLGEQPVRRRHWIDYAQSLGLVLLASLLGRPFSPTFDHANLVMFYLLAEVIAAIRFGLGPSIVAAVFSVVAFHTFFVLPYFAFAIDEVQYLLSFSGLFLVGLVISILTATLREQVEIAQNREIQATASYDFSRALAEAVGLQSICQVVVKHIDQVFVREAVIFLLDGTKLSRHAFAAKFTLDDQEYAIANWSFQQQKPAGRGTSIHVQTQLRYHPLRTARGCVGVLGIQPVNTGESLWPAQYRLLEVFASQAAVAIERSQLAEQAQQAQLLRETEKLQTALLNSISHDLRTPLASITGTLSSLRDDSAYLNEATKHELIDNAWEEAERLNHLVANLLDMTRLQAGGLKALRKPCDIQDLIGVVLAEMTKRLADRPITVNVPANLPLIPLDFVLMSRVFINLLDNADKYSPPGVPIEITARVSGENQIEIAITDGGPGIAPQAIDHVFDRFYRAPQTARVRGTGLGLSICRGIVDIHNGDIWAENYPDGGTRVKLILPIDVSTIANP